MARIDESSSGCFDAIAARYDELTSSDPRHTWVRGAFQSLVAKTVAPGSLILDFGCGTGTDSLWYAERGYRVLAYDNSVGMIEQLRVKCSGRISAGNITPYSVPFKVFLRQPLRPKPVAVVSNFAVLSVIEDLPHLFAAWAQQVDRPGHIIVSLLNPLFWEDMLHPAWWKLYFGSKSKKKIMIRRSEGKPDAYAYFHSALVTAASPHFIKIGYGGVGALTGGSQALQPWSTPSSIRERLEKRLWTVPPIRTFGQFMFLVFRKADRRPRGLRSFTSSQT